MWVQRCVCGTMPSSDEGSLLPIAVDISFLLMEKLLRNNFTFRWHVDGSLAFEQGRIFVS